MRLASVPTPKGPRLGLAKRWLGRRARMRAQCEQEKHLIASGWKVKRVRYIRYSRGIRPTVARFAKAADTEHSN